MSRPETELQQQPAPNYGGGFMGGLMGVLGPHIEQQHQLGLENKKKLAQPYWDAAIAAAQRGYDLHNQYTEAQAKGAPQDQLDAIEKQIEQAEQDHSDFMAQYTKTIPGGNNPGLKEAIGKIGNLFHITKSARGGKQGMGIVPPPAQVKQDLSQQPPTGNTTAAAQPTAPAQPAPAQGPAPHLLPPPTPLSRAIGATYGQAQSAANIAADRQIRVKNEEEKAIAAAQANVAQIRADATTEAATTRANATVKAAEERAKKVTETAVVNARKAGLIASVDPDTQEITFRPITEAEMTDQEKANAKKTNAQANQAQAAADRPATITAATLADAAAKGDKIAERALKLLKPGETTSLTPEAIGMLGQMFAMTGVLPSMGMGGKADRELVFNEAAHQLDANNADPATQKAIYEANKTALTKQVTTQAAINAFEATAKENLTRALDTAKDIVDSGSPLLNQPLRLVDEKVLGSNKLAAFRTARQVALNEVAKITSNPNLTGVLSDSARHEVESLVSENATLGQIYAAADILVKDMDSRKKNTDATVEALKDQIKKLGQKSAPTPLPPPPAGKIRVKGPNGETGTANRGAALPPGWTEVK